MKQEETFTQALDAIRQSEKRIKEFIKVARIADRPRRESKLSGIQIYYITLTSIITVALTAVILTPLLR